MYLHIDAAIDFNLLLFSGPWQHFAAVSSALFFLSEEANHYTTLWNKGAKKVGSTLFYGTLLQKMVFQGFFNKDNGSM